MEDNLSAVRNKLAVKYGLLVGLIYMVITTGISIAVNKFVLFMVLGLLAYILYFFLLGIFARRIRIETGGFLTFKEAFTIVFIMICISITMSYLYDILYMTVMDPGYLDKIKNSTLTFMEGFHMPEKSYDKMVKQMDESTEDARKFAIGKSALILLRSIITHTIGGLLVCVSVKKKKPEHLVNLS
jgi:Protein of unknown function (DUF4199)